MRVSHSCRKGPFLARPRAVEARGRSTPVNSTSDLDRESATGGARRFRVRAFTVFGRSHFRLGALLTPRLNRSARGLSAGGRSYFNIDRIPSRIVRFRPIIKQIPLTLLWLTATTLGAIPLMDGARQSPRLGWKPGRLLPQVANAEPTQLHPLVPPHVSHFRHVPFLRSVKLPHEPQASPS
jgi:hypothetical protein